MKSDANPMQRAHAALRCNAKAKRTGQQCKAPAVAGWAVCRMHGARGGAPEGKNNGSWRHGGRTREMEAFRHMVAEVTRLNRAVRATFESERD